MLLAAPASAQQVSDKIEVTRSVVGAERKMIISKNLDLTEAESEAFWPIYNEYEQAIRKVNDKRVALIREFAAGFDTVDDKQAEDLMKDYLSYQEEHVKTRRSYVKKFRKVLPARKTFRFYQIDGKLNVIVDFELARGIPLVQ
jgi:ferritin